MNETLYTNACNFWKEQDELLLSLKEMREVSICDSSYNFENMKKLTDTIPKYRKEHGIGQFGAKSRHPDNFAFILAVVLNKQYEKWEDVDIKRELKLRTVFTMPVMYKDNIYENTVYDDDIPCHIYEGMNTCICGHPSNTIFLYETKKTGIVIPIGTSCVEKYGITDEKKVKKIKHIIKKAKDTLKMTRPCLKCDADFVAENTEEVECKKCRVSKFPKCEYCFEEFRPKAEWMKTCIYCYKEHSRNCKCCDNVFLPPYKNKHFATMCGKCYYKNKN